MRRTLQAFIWLHWRVFINSLERTSARDTLQRFSLATEKIGPIIKIALLIPSAFGLFLLGMAGGFGLGQSSWPWILLPALVRYFLLFATFFTIFGPIVLSSRDTGNVIRFLLLPIERLALYIAQTAGAFADPWIMLTLPVLVGVPLGALVGGHPLIAALTLAGGVALMLLIVGLTSLTSTVIHLLLRDRRRGDLVMLAVVLVLPLIGLLPSLLQTGRTPHRRDPHQTYAPRPPAPPSTTQQIARGAFSLSPSELYYRTGFAAARRPGDALLPLAGLAGMAFGVQLIGFVAFKRMLDMPVTAGARRGGAFGGLWGRTIPGLSPGASAVAFTQLRLAMRTPRGRSILAGPLLIFTAFAIMVYRSGGMSFPGLPIDSGLSLATFGSFVSLFSILPLAMNQFAIDKAGFTRYMLTPLSLGELLQGKAVGNALIAAGPALCCFVVPALIFRGGNPSLWLALLFSMVATYLLVAPAAAALSAVFPRSVDLSSIGHASNAHQGAALLGLLTCVCAAIPCAVLVLIAIRALDRPALAPFLVLVWCAMAYVIARLIFIPVRRLVASRCEALSQMI
jgi:hypothetical protein